MHALFIISSQLETAKDVLLILHFWAFSGKLFLAKINILEFNIKKYTVLFF